MTRKGRIGILTGGGDCPGINSVIRAVTKKAILECGFEVIGFEYGYEGVIRNHYRRLEYDDVSGIITVGGTILGTSNTANPYRHAVRKGDRLEFEDVSQEAIANIRSIELDCLVCIGGDGTLSIAHNFFRDGIPVIGVPKTIDNDLRGTDVTFGFDSAVSVATEGVDRLHTTAQSHRRVMILEVMGRTAGWIALHAGVAGGGDIILIPEIPYHMESIVNKIMERNRKGRRFSIVVVAEGARPVGGDIVIQKIVEESTDPVRLGGIGFALGVQVEKLTGMETRVVVMGHLQRGGIPTPFDRVLATKLGAMAVDMIKKEAYGYMPGIKGDTLVEVPLEEVARGPKNVPIDNPVLKAARAVGTCFGDRL